MSALYIVFPCKFRHVCDYSVSRWQCRSQSIFFFATQLAIQMNQWHLSKYILYMNHPTELREKMFQRSRKVSRNFCQKLNLLFRFKLEKYLCIIVADLPLIAKI